MPDVQPAMTPPLLASDSSARSLDISVIVVTHRTCNQVRDCLRTLVREGGLDGTRGEVILVDNASGDGTAEMARQEFPDVRLLALDENIGFSRGNNAGIAAATGRNILLLNPDTLVPPGALAKCVEFLDAQDSDTAAMTCRVQSVDGTYQWTASRRLITPWSECCRALLLDRIFPRSDWFNREQMVGWDRRDTRQVEGLLGAFMLIRRAAIEQIGVLDERFFLMYEDIDWCKRAQTAGLKCWFWPGAYITHIGGQFWKQEPVVTFANSHLSAMAYFRKHYPRSVGVVQAVSRAGMALKVALLRLNLIRKPGDAYTVSHLQMARAAQEALRTGKAMTYGNWADTVAAESGKTLITPSTP